MAYAIIAGLFIAVMGWAVFMSRRAKRGHGEKFAKANFRGPVRRYPMGGKKIVQSDVQRSEVILANRDQYDQSIDLLDPHHRDYKGPEFPAT